MPQRRNAIKALRLNAKNRLHNLDIKTALRKSIKKYLGLVANKSSAEAETQLKTLYKKFDKAAKRNLIHKNTASHRKSRFARMLQDLNKKAA